MKKLVALLLLAAMCLSLAACGKSDAVKAVEAMIDALSEVSDKTLEEAFAIQEAYDALTEDEQKKVKNYEDFSAQRDAYLETVLTGTWYPFDLALHEPEYIFNPRCSITLHEDGNLTHEGVHSGTGYAAWDVTGGELLLPGLMNLDTENSSHYFHEGSGSLSIILNDGKLQLALDDTWFFMRLEDYLAKADEVIRVVDLETEDPADYLGFGSLRCYSYDEWGTETGSSIRIAPTNLLYEEGWMYLAISDDFALEVLYPEHNYTYYYTDGDVHVSAQDAGSYTFTYSPFMFEASALTNGHFWDNATVESDLTLDQFTFGRAKGQIYFINSMYVEDIRRNEETGCRELVLKASEYSFLGQDSYTHDWWEADNVEY